MKKKISKYTVNEKGVWRNFENAPPKLWLMVDNTPKARIIARLLNRESGKLRKSAVRSVPRDSALAD